MTKSAGQKNSLSRFHPLVAEWFAETLGKPTAAQTLAWREIAAGGHVLVTAPTGTGKTLAAFLWAIDRLVTGAWPVGETRVLYISPLKALNNDIRRNLEAPLAQIRSRFERGGLPVPDIRALTRSGDTPADARRAMLRKPPEILITTPESLNILLTSPNSRRILAGVRTVIMDEVHAVAGSKRGTHMVTAVERLAALAGEFQRIALSATVRPVETVAAFVGGFGEGGAPRRVAVAGAGDDKKYRITVHDARGGDAPGDEGLWPRFAEELCGIARAHRSTLVFTNSRRHAEKAARLMNEAAGEDLAYAHHGSLSREIRLAVEERLKAGELRAIVATSSLELGIDIGALDRVVLAGTPYSVASALQRVGRAGHRVGEESAGDIYALHGMDLVAAAVTARAIAARDIEPVRPVECPLDVLAQVLLSMTSVEPWDVDALFAFITRAYPYRKLPRRQFDLVLEMLAGRYAGTRLPDLAPRVHIDRVDNTVRAREGSQRLIYSSGGTIPDRGYFDLRTQDTRAKIGELDEEFVWERKPGDTFALGTQVWRIMKISHSDVEVAPAAVQPGIMPFWKAEEANRDFHASERIGTFLERADSALEDPMFARELESEYAMDPGAAETLVSFLKRQREATGTPLPHRRHIVAEHLDDTMGSLQRRQVVLHLPWGGRLTRPFALALAAAWEERFGYALETFPGNECILVILPHKTTAADMLSLVTPENLERLLRAKLEHTGFFGAQFRENAGRALVLPRAGFGKRVPLWLTRLRAKRVLDATMRFEDFPVLIETWRSCMGDEFDLEHLKELLAEVQNGTIRVSEAFTKSASPFASGVIWRETNHYMYQDDAPAGGKTSSLRGDLIREILYSSSLRPRIPNEIIALLSRRLARTEEGYAPRSADEALDWVKERTLIPEDEWEALDAAVARDSGIALPAMLEGQEHKLAWITPPGAPMRSVISVESAARVAGALRITDFAACLTAFGGMETDSRMREALSLVESRASRGEAAPEPTGPDELIAQWLAYCGPVGPGRLGAIFGLPSGELDALLASLAERGEVVIDSFSEESGETEVCVSDNLEILLRMARRAREPRIEARPIDQLPLFLASWQGLASPGGRIEDLQDDIETLFGFPAPAAAWEEHILPARLSVYHQAWLDSLCASSGLVWFGCGNRRASFAFTEDLDLFMEDVPRSEGVEARAPILPPGGGRHGFFDVVRNMGLPTARAAAELWDAAWRGEVTNDAFATLRRGILTEFTPEDAATAHGRRPGRRAGLGRWSSTRPVTGSWYALPARRDRDALEEHELARDRARTLLARYGVIFRELLAHELPCMQWGRVFRALRLMELSGEIVSGRFFEGVPGLQFASPEAVREIASGLPDDAVYWMSAADPASPCGLRLDALKGNLPPRLASTFLVFHGARLVLTARKNGSDCEIDAPPDSPAIPRYLGLFRALLSRDFNPVRTVLVTTINSLPSQESGYARAFIDYGFVRRSGGLELSRAY
ncbi:MAG: DEAD/DEAH box helicase [Spirochaetes bacterium]|nr:MAG: DEAD/DEAH box helicase [Spirochaetota bacterium]